MSNSKLVNYTKLSPYCNKPRNHKIDKITIHHMAGNLSVETCGNVFQNSQSSSNYGIGTDGRVGMYVEEANRSWCSSSPSNDHRAVTIEVANDEVGGNWHVSDKALAKLIDLCVDICKRNGIKKLNFTGDKNGNLTMHKWFANTNCPGPYLESKFPYIADEINKRLGVKSEPTSSVKITEDGKWGTDTTKRLQQIFGTTVDGIVSNQHLAYKDKNPGLVSGWEWVAKPNGKGSQLIKAMQKWAGMPVRDQDGEVGPKTFRAIQTKLGTPVDGKVSNPSAMVKALQRWANSQ
jgi:hypothetical protein